jgi:hypothetical protein
MRLQRLIYSSKSSLVESAIFVQYLFLLGVRSTKTVLCAGFSFDKVGRDMINPESSDPKDPETNTWWVWIPIMITLVILFGTLVFERDFLYEGQVQTPTFTRSA